MSTVLIFILATLAFLIIGKIYRMRRFLYLASKIPSPKGQIPFIGGSLLFLRSEMHEIFYVMEKFQKTIGNEFLKIWFGSEIVIPVFTPELAKQVLTAKECNDRAKFTIEFVKLPNSTLFGNLDIWKHHRRILNPVLSTPVLNKWAPIFNEKSEKLTNYFKKYCGKEAFDIYTHNSAFFLETTLDIQMDLKVDLINHKDNSLFVKHLEK